MTSHTVPDSTVMNMSKTLMQSYEIRVRMLALAVSMLCLVAFSQTQNPTDRKLDGVYYVAYRAPAHVSRSSPEVFHEVANKTLDLLKQNGVNVVADPERGTIETSDLFSLDSLLSLTRNAGATSLLYLTVDRPAMS